MIKFTFNNGEKLTRGEKFYLYTSIAGCTFVPVAIQSFYGESWTVQAFGFVVWFCILMFGFTGLTNEKRKKKEAKDAD